MITKDEFIAASAYTAPVDHKKLGFIYEALEAQRMRAGKAWAELTVLEIGCGVGGITIPIATAGCSIRALDVDQGDVDALLAEVAARDLRDVKATVEDAFAFSETDPFDVVIASEVFEHVLDPEALAEIIYQHLVPGGLFVMTTPNGYGPWELSRAVSPYHIARKSNFIRRFTGREPYQGGTGRDHCQRFTQSSLRRVFEPAGLHMESFQGSDFILTIVRAFRQHRVLGALDARMGSVVPTWMASGWYATFRKANTEEVSV